MSTRDKWIGAVTLVLIGFAIFGELLTPLYGVIGFGLGYFLNRL